MASTLQALAPVYDMAITVLTMMAPMMERTAAAALSLWTLVQPYHPDILIPAIFGLFLSFFGGTFLLTLACIEAYRMCGWNQTMKHLGVLYSTYCQVLHASHLDDQVDDNNDGIADVKQITKKQLIERKVLLALRTSDPDTVSKALGGIYTGFMAVIATLRYQFAQVITIGAVIGDALADVAHRFIRPILVVATPKDFHAWIPVVVNYVSF